MKFFFIGLIFGAVLNFIFFLPESGVQINALWHGKVNDLSSIEKSPLFMESSSEKHFIKKENIFTLIDGTGSQLATVDVDENLSAHSGNGMYYAKYEKVGKNIELYGITGGRYWNLKSLEYPYLSNNAKLILLLNGDQSRIRILDLNGQSIGTGSISGRLNTVISFSEQNDFAAVGFLSGGYYILNESGNIIADGMAPKGNIVKTAAVSSNGKFAVIHFGNTDLDSLKIINIEKEKESIYNLKHTYKTNAVLNISDEGRTCFIDTDKIIILKPNGRLYTEIEIKPKREGYGSLSFWQGIYSAGYTDNSGLARFLLFNDKGKILMNKGFSSDSFLQAKISDGVIFLRGSDNLFCYRMSY
jgi:hypothetical protein